MNHAVDTSSAVAGLAASPIVTLDERSHTYTHRDGFHPPSVTTLLSAVPPWLGRFAHVSPDVLDYKRQIGIQVHRATHFYDEGSLDLATVDPVVMPYLLAWQKFRMEKLFTPMLMETAVFHPTYGYAGTFDRLGVADTRTGIAPVITDLKTGDGSMAGPQMAAYLEAWTAMQGPLVKPPAAPTQRWTVQLHDDGRYTLTVHTDRRDWPVFLAALELFTYHQRSHR